MDIESSDIALERILLRVATGDTVALASLLEDADAAHLIEEVSRWAERRYKHDRADIRQALALQILTRIHTLRNPRLLRQWLHYVARNHCLDEKRRQVSETRALERLERNPLLPPEPLTPEQQMINQENEEEVLLRLRRVTRSYPSQILERWARGESPKQIAEGTGKPIATIYRLLKTMRSGIIEELAIENSEPSFEQMRTERALPSIASGETSTRSPSRKPRRGRVNVSDVRAQTRRIGSFSAAQILSAMEQLGSTELEELVPRAIALGAARRAPHLKPEESKFLARANQALPSELKSRLSQLQHKRDASSLTESEFEELTALSDRLELLHAERLEALADLARLRGLTLAALMDQLGIRFPDNA